MTSNGAGTDDRTTLLEFPCRFPIKAMGHNSEQFVSVVSEIILSRATLYAGEEITTSASKAGKYLALTAVIEATSRDQLDSIYLALTDSDLVVMAL